MSVSDGPTTSVPSGFLPGADFPLYGVDSWPGYRELDDTVHPVAGRRSLGPAVGYWLGHQTLDRRGGVRVGTFHRQRLDRSVEWGQFGKHHRGPRRHLSAVPEGSGDVLAAVARLGTAALEELTSPDPETPAPGPGSTQIDRRISRHLAAVAEEYGRWQLVTWMVEGEQVPARVTHFAGGWTGFAVRPAAYLAAVGVAVDPAILRLRAIDPTDEYGLDLTVPLFAGWRLQPEVMHREVWGTVLRRPNRYAFHPDQLALLSD